MGIWENYKRRSQEEKEAINQMTGGLSGVGKIATKIALKANIGSSPASKLFGAVIDTIKDKKY